jgi:hypothetical protein
MSIFWAVGRRTAALQRPLQAKDWILLPQKMKLVRKGISTVTSFVIRSVVLSASPDTVNCFAGAIVSGTSNVAFCHPGVDSYRKGCYPEVNELQDMVYFQGGGDMHAGIPCPHKGRVRAWGGLQGFQ